MIKKTLLLFLCFLISSLRAQGIEGVYQVIVKKQEEKKSTRWTLADWLLTKQKMALMDQWLALHSSSQIFEFFIEGQGGDLDFGESGSPVSTAHSESFQGAAYIRALGFQGGIDHFSGALKSNFYQVNLILLGSSAQSTNIQLHYGQRNMETDRGEFSPTYFQVSTTLYLLPFLGGLYQYRNYSDDAGTGSFNYSDGVRQEYGAFIDLWIFRLKGTYFKEVNQYSSASTSLDQQVSGWWFGGQIFF